jgi:hypothetical protein
VRLALLGRTAQRSGASIVLQDAQQQKAERIKTRKYARYVGLCFSLAEAKRKNIVQQNAEVWELEKNELGEFASIAAKSLGYFQAF